MDVSFQKHKPPIHHTASAKVLTAPKNIRDSHSLDLYKEQPLFKDTPDNVKMRKGKSRKVSNVLKIDEDINLLGDQLFYGNLVDADTFEEDF